MANHEHIEWLREGVNSWNRRQRTNQDFNPDFSSEDISRKLGGHEREDIRKISVHLEGVNLYRANFKDATLRDTNLTRSYIALADFSNANLQGSNFTESTAVESNFRNAAMWSSNFSRAKIWCSDLGLARLGGADLRGAQIWECNLKGTHLYDSNLIGANFGQSRPWTARLFSQPEQTIIDFPSLDSENIDGIDALLRKCREFRKIHGEEIVLYFRGESSCSWELRPSIMRNPHKNQAHLRIFENDLLNDLMTRRPDEFSQLNSSLAQWVLAQHHGLKTRLLDISRNPLVALFSACNDHLCEDGRIHIFAVPRSLIKPFDSDTVSVIANFAKLPKAEQNVLLGKTQDDCTDEPFPKMESSVMDLIEAYPKAMAHLCSIIRQEKPHFEERIDIRDFYRVIVVEPQLMFERIRVQSGAFLISAFHEKFEREEVLRTNREFPIYAHFFFTVPKTHKQAVLDDLRLLNVTRETLFPSVDEAARAVIERFQKQRPRRRAHGDPC